MHHTMSSIFFSLASLTVAN